MAPPTRPPVGQAAEFWAVAGDLLAKKEIGRVKELAAAELAKPGGSKYRTAGLSFISALVGLSEAVSLQAGEALSLLVSNLGATWGEVATLFAIAQQRIAAEGPGEAAKNASAAAKSLRTSGDTWGAAAELCTVSLATLMKDGPAAPRDAMQSALALCAQIGLAWGETGVPGSVASLHLTPKDVDLQAAIAGPAQSKPGKERGIAMLKAASAWLLQKDPEEALQMTREALAVFRELKAEDLEATALRMQAKAHMLNGTYIDALEAANKAVKIFKDLKHFTGQAMSLHVVGLVFQARQEVDEALWKSTEALKILQQLGLRMQEAGALQTVVECSIASEEYKKGLQAASDALAISKELGDGFGEGVSMCLQSQIQAGLKDTQQGLETAKAALSKAQDLGDATLQLQALDAIVGACVKMDEPDKAQVVLTEKQQEFKASSRKEEADVFYKIAKLYQLVSEVDLGCSAASSAVRLYSLNGDNMGHAKALVLMAELLAFTQDYQDSHKRAGDALVVSKTLSRQGMAIHVEAVGLMVGADMAMGNLESAREEAKDAFKYFNARRERKYEASALMIMAEVEEKSGESQKAVDMLMYVPALFLAVGDKVGQARAWTKIAQLHTTGGDPELARQAAKEAMVAYKSVGDQKGKAVASTLFVEANFMLLGAGQGNAQDTLSAAKDAVSVYRASGDQKEEAQALINLANAQLMSNVSSDALQAATKAEEIFTRMGDLGGQASALLLASGAHVREGRFEEAKDQATEASNLSREVGNAMGEDTAEAFLDEIDEYKSGKLSNEDFLGFGVAPPNQAATYRKKPKKKATAKANAPDLTDYWLFTVGDKGKQEIMAWFDGFEGRAARGPVQRMPQGSALKDQGQDGQSKRQILYTVRWVTKAAPPEAKPDVAENLRDTFGTADKRVGLSMELSEPHSGFGGRFAPSDRMFHAMGGARGI